MCHNWNGWTNLLLSLFTYLISPSISTLAPPSQSQGPSLTASWVESRKLLRCSAPTCCCCYEPLEHIPTGFAFVFVFVVVFVFVCLCNCNYLFIPVFVFLFVFVLSWHFCFSIFVCLRLCDCRCICICICLLPIKAHTTRVGLCLSSMRLLCGIVIPPPILTWGLEVLT